MTDITTTIKKIAMAIPVTETAERNGPNWEELPEKKYRQAIQDENFI